MANNKVASQIPSEYFLRNSTIALEDNDEYQDIFFDPPPYDGDKNYYHMFWGSFIENERILNEIQDVSNDNLQNLNQIYNLEDFYENNLLPKMYAFPHQYVSRIVASQNRKGFPRIWPSS